METPSSLFRSFSLHRDFTVQTRGKKEKVVYPNGDFSNRIKGRKERFRFKRVIRLRSKLFFISILEAVDHFVAKMSTSSFFDTVVTFTMFCHSWTHDFY